MRIISDAALQRRAYWITEIVKIGDHFGTDAARVEAELVDEYAQYGRASLIDHLRLCGAIPESYHHDSSEEKLYSKYTDAVVAQALRAMGCTSLILTERADAADVEAVADDFTFVADAKAFRLSRTAKNQKDFKIQAMDGWRRDKDFAVVVAPLYQLPVRSSQIYQQAVARNVCILTFSHLAVLVSYAESEPAEARAVLKDIFECVEMLPPTKEALSYWTVVNGHFGKHGSALRHLWRLEKAATLESIEAAKKEALDFLASERTRIMQLSREEAVRQLIDKHNLGSRVATIGRIADPGIMEIGSAP
jgi:hypothetical protein